MRGRKSFGTCSILQYDETLGQISFTHQTLVDFARARAFVTQEGSLGRFVLARQTALFVRPKLWSGLAYLRANEADLRQHLRLLLIDFAGMQEVPQPFEMSAIIAAVMGCAFFSIGFSVGRCRILPPGPATYTATYTDQPGKDLQILAQA